MTLASLGETNRHAECMEERKSLNILGPHFSVYFSLLLIDTFAICGINPPTQQGDLSAND